MRLDCIGPSSIDGYRDWDWTRQRDWRALQVRQFAIKRVPDLLISKGNLFTIVLTHLVLTNAHLFMSKQSLIEEHNYVGIKVRFCIV